MSSSHTPEPDVGEFDLRRVRQLYDGVTQHRPARHRLFAEMLAPAMRNWSAFSNAFGRYRRFASSPPIAPGTEHDGDLKIWYGLSRLFDWFIDAEQHFDPRKSDPPPPEHPYGYPLPDLRTGFFGALGMESLARRSDFHPFFHEIVAAQFDPSFDDAILIEDEVWSGLKFGDLLFARAGVRVRCGPVAAMDPAIASSSRLYWTYQRRGRPTSDLSHGWGHNSQWSTSMRRDYVDGNLLRYNVDGRRSLNEVGDVLDRDGLSRAERIELVRHRCFVLMAKPDSDLWPYDDCYVEPAP